jgi:plasmid maintenance system antidote protein VapI
MMEESVFDYSDYVELLKSKAGPEGTRRGVRLAMAKALECHSSYLTKVLNSTANLSLEQALKLTEYFGMTAEEAEYFLLLVEKARAGTSALKKHFDFKLEKSRQQRLSLKERVSIKKTPYGTDGLKPQDSFGACKIF